jgi:hypothetical protein
MGARGACGFGSAASTAGAAFACRLEGTGSVATRPAERSEKRAAGVTTAAGTA